MFVEYIFKTNVKVTNIAFYQVVIKTTEEASLPFTTPFLAFAKLNIFIVSLLVVHFRLFFRATVFNMTTYVVCSRSLK